MTNCQLDGWVEVVPGDMGREMFGLNSSTYVNLCEHVEAIINVAVNNSFQEKYYASKEISSCRICNIQGLKNIFEFAVSKKLKHVFYASTIVAQKEIGEDGLYSESWPTLDQIAHLPNSAYPISKVICDLIAQETIQRRIPCKVFRFPNIGGDSVTCGNIKLDNFMMIRFYTYMYLGIMPAYNIPLCMMPVDLCAEFSVNLFFNDEAPSSIYNIFNPNLGNVFKA